MIPLLIVAGVIALLVFLLLMPVTLQVRYHDGFEVGVRYLFLRFPWKSEEKPSRVPPFCRS